MVGNQSEIQKNFLNTNLKIKIFAASKSEPHIIEYKHEKNRGPKPCASAPLRDLPVRLNGVKMDQSIGFPLTPMLR